MSCTEQTLLSETYLRKLLPGEIFQIGDIRFFIDISGLKAQMHFQIVDVSFYWQGYQKGFFPVKLDLLFSPSPFLQCDWWSSQWGRGESRGSQKGWGMMFDAPCIYQISKFAIINLNLLCFFGTNGSFWNLDLQKEIPSQRETQPPRAAKKLPSWYSSKCYNLLCTVW